MVEFIVTAEQQRRGQNALVQSLSVFGSLALGHHEILVENIEPSVFHFKTPIFGKGTRRIQDFDKFGPAEFEYHPIIVPFSGSIRMAKE